MTPPPTPTSSALASPRSSHHHSWHISSTSSPTILILLSSLIMPQILCVYPSSAGDHTWSIESISSASTVHSLPLEPPPPLRNPFDSHSFKPRFKLPRSRQSHASSPFKPMDVFHVIDDPGFRTPQSIIIRVQGSRRDSQGHTIHSVDISQFSTMEHRVILPYELYCRRSRNILIVYCRRTWQRFRDFIGW